MTLNMALFRTNEGETERERGREMRISTIVIKCDTDIVVGMVE